MSVGAPKTCVSKLSTAEHPPVTSTFSINSSGEKNDCVNTELFIVTIEFLTNTVTEIVSAHIRGLSSDTVSVTL